MSLSSQVVNPALSAAAISGDNVQHTATHCNTLQHTATHYHTLPHTATHCNTLQHAAAYYSTLQHTATHCNTLQHTATYCNDTPQRHCNHTVPHCNSLKTTCKGALFFALKIKLDSVSVFKEGVCVDFAHFHSAKKMQHCYTVQLTATYCNGCTCRPRRFSFNKEEDGKHCFPHTHGCVLFSFSFAHKGSLFSRFFLFFLSLSRERSPC